MQTVYDELRRRRRLGIGAQAGGKAELGKELAKAGKGLLPKDANKMLAEIGEAAAIIGAASVVPVIGTAGGAVIAAVKILGPKVFKGLVGAFAPRKNPWVKRIGKVMVSKQKPSEKYLALYALQRLAAEKTSGGDSSTRRWARGAIVRIDSEILSLWNLLSPATQKLALARVTAPGAREFMALPMKRLATFIMQQAQLVTRKNWAAFQAKHPNARRSAVLAQLQVAQDVYRRRYMPPVPKRMPRGQTPAKLKVKRRTAVKRPKKKKKKPRAKKKRPKKKKKKKKTRGVKRGPDLLAAAGKGKLRSNKPGDVSRKDLAKASREGRVYWLAA